MDIQEALEFADRLVFHKTGEHLSDLQRELLKSSWSWEHQSYEQIATGCGYSGNYLRKHVGPSLWKLLSAILQEKVSKTNARAAFERRLQQAAADSATVPRMTLNAATPLLRRPHVDWGEATALDGFYGRESELQTLMRWVVADRCRLVGVFGVGGIGKTSLSVKLAQQIAAIESDACTEVPCFDYVIWRSLRSAPPLSDLLLDLLQTISAEPHSPLPSTPSAQIAQFLYRLQQQRCLLVLDNGETLLQGGQVAGHYRPGYETYADLFRQIGEGMHQSCVLLTSREKLKELAWIEGDTLPVRSLALRGLGIVEGQAILRQKHLAGDTTLASVSLVQRYGGNPLGLKIVAATIQDVFAGNIAAFLRQQVAIFDGVSDLLDQHYDRLSPLEQQVLFWLAIACEPIALDELQADLFPTVSQRQILEAIKSLRLRSLLEKSDALFTLQPVVTEYLLDRLIDSVFHDLTSTPPLSTTSSLFHTHALIKAQGKDYIRETQKRLILMPLAERLQQRWRSWEAIGQRLLPLLEFWRSSPSLEIGYGAGNLFNLLHHLGADLRDTDFSQMPVWQAHLEGVNLQGTNFTGADLSKSVLAETLSKTLCVCFSPNGQGFATAASNGDVCLWQAADAEKRLVCQGHTGWVHAVAFSPDSSLVISGSEDATIRIWDTQTGQCLRSLSLGIWVWSVAISPDGHALASGSNDGLVCLWDLATGALLQTLTGHEGWVRSVAFSPDGQWLMSSSHDQTIRIWDRATGQCLKILRGHTDCIQAISISPNGQLLASGSNDHTVRLWHLITGQCLRVLQGHTNWVQSVAFSPDSSTLASSSNDPSIRLWDVQSGKCLRVLQGQMRDIWSVAFSPDGSRLVSGSSDEIVQLWDTQSGLCLKTVRGYSNLVRSLAFSPDGKLLANGGDDQTIRIWDVAQKTCLRILEGHHNATWAVAFNPQFDSWLASGSNDHTIRLWDLHQGRCLREFQGHTSWVRAIAFSPDGHTLASGSTDQTVKLWDVLTGECLKTWIGHTNWVRSVAFSPDGQWVASAGDDQTIHLWHVLQQQASHSLTGHQGGIWAIAFHPNGQLLASSSDDHTIRLWHLPSGAKQLRLDGHTNWVRSVAFSPTGDYLASASDDHTIKLWQLSTGQCLHTLVGHQGGVWSLTFSPDGQTIASGGEDETIRFWTVASGLPHTCLKAERIYEGMNISATLGLTEMQKATLRSLGAVDA